MTLDELMAANPHAAGMFRDLKDERSKRQALEAAETARKEKELTEQGQFKTLADQKAAEAKTYREKYENSAKQNAFNAAALKKGITDIDAAWKLAEQGKITLDDQGTISGVDAVVEELAKSKPYLVGKPGAVGSPSAPGTSGGEGGKRTYKRSELRDVSFFEKNKADIMLAAKEGRISEE